MPYQHMSSISRDTTKTGMYEIVRDSSEAFYEAYCRRPVPGTIRMGRQMSIREMQEE